MLLCITPNLKSQSYIKSIEHGVYTNHNFSYPFTQMGVCTNHGLYLEIGMLDLPTEVNFRFNQTIQQRSGRLSWMVPIWMNLLDIVERFDIRNSTIQSDILNKSKDIE